MDLREQEYVVALARHQSITKAAEELYISQPTLSIFLNRLEERMACLSSTGGETPGSHLRRSALRPQRPGNVGDPE